nr:lipase family protein [Mycobacterium sp.]
MRPGGNAPAMPMLVLQYVHDPLVGAADIDSRVQRYSAAGAHLEYVRDRLSDDLILAAVATPTMVDRLAD